MAEAEGRSGRERQRRKTKEENEEGMIGFPVGICFSYLGLELLLRNEKGKKCNDFSWREERRAGGERGRPELHWWGLWGSASDETQRQETAESDAEILGFHFSMGIVMSSS